MEHLTGKQKDISYPKLQKPTQTKEGYIYLTESGQKIADMIYERHEFLSSWLISLGVDPETATSDACRIEHVISPESFTAIKEHLSPGK